MTEEQQVWLSAYNMALQEAIAICRASADPIKSASYLAVMHADEAVVQYFKHFPKPILLD